MAAKSQKFTLPDGTVVSARSETEAVNLIARGGRPAGAPKSAGASQAPTPSK